MKLVVEGVVGESGEGWIVIWGSWGKWWGVDYKEV